MKIILTVDSLSGEYGGPSRSVPALGQALTATGVDVELWTLDDGGEDVDGVDVRFFQNSRQLAHAIGQADRNSVVLHDNGLWVPFNVLVCRAALNNRITYAISPRGMLDSWSMQQSYWKKKCAWTMYQRRLLRGAALLHATGNLEARGFRQLGLSNPIVVQPNGIAVPATVSVRKLANKNVLYLSRIHEKKGLEMLFAAWAGLRPEGWRLSVAGTGEPRYLDSLRALAVQLGISEQVQWLGELSDQRKWAAYAEADFFVLPSYSENFGIVVGEALSSAVPVVTTTATAWVDLEKQGCGMSVPPEQQPIKDALKAMLSLSHAERTEMGTRGRELIQRSYTWSSIAEKMIEAYDAALSGVGMSCDQSQISERA